MPGVTPIYGFPYPEPSDLVANYPALGQDLAEDIEAVLPTLGGLSPIAPTTIANSGGSASLVGNAVTFSGVTSISSNGVFTSTYTNYLVVYNGTASGSTQLTARYRAAGTDEASSVYLRGSLFVSTAAEAFDAGSGSSTVTQYGNVTSTGRTNMVANIFNPNTAATETNNFFQSNHNTYYAGWNRCTATTAFDGISFIAFSGNFTGVIRFYGYKD